MKIIPTLLLFVAVLTLIVLNMCFFAVQETEQAILTQFGKPVGQPITQAGLHFKLPFIQKVNVLEKRVMEWDGESGNDEANQLPTKDKLFIKVDTFARWRIKDPLLFFQSLRDERSAQSRLDDILDGETRNSIAKHALIEVVRTDKNREPVYDDGATSAVTVVANWEPITLGREKIAHEIFLNSSKKLVALGIELIDVRFKRINYNREVQNKIYERMVSERKQIADKFRSEGMGEAARIRGERERDLKQIESEAYKTIQEIEGRADATATAIYAKSYNKSPEANSFYQFQKTMETYSHTLDKNTILVLSSSGDLFKFLQDADIDQIAPATPATPIK